MSDSFLIEQRAHELLQADSDRLELARAAQLLHGRLMEPVLQAWMRTYPRVPPTLEAHLKAQSEFAVLESVSRALEALAEAPMPGRMEDAMSQAESELRDIQRMDAGVE